MIERASFRSLGEATTDELQITVRAHERYAAQLPGRVLAHLNLLPLEDSGLAVDRLEHCLQTATRACNAGRDDEYVVCALLHDIGDTLASHNHPDLAAAILKPFVSEQNHWMVQNHAAFQAYYFYEALRKDRNVRDQFRGKPYYDATEEFCRLFDEPSFDPGFKSMPLREFEPALRRVMRSPKR